MLVEVQHGNRSFVLFGDSRTERTRCFEQYVEFFVKIGAEIRYSDGEVVLIGQNCEMTEFYSYKAS